MNEAALVNTLLVEVTAAVFQFPTDRLDVEATMNMASIDVTATTYSFPTGSQEVDYQEAVNEGAASKLRSGPAPQGAALHASYP